MRQMYYLAGFLKKFVTKSHIAFFLSLFPSIVLKWKSFSKLWLHSSSMSSLRFWLLHPFCVVFSGIGSCFPTSDPLAMSHHSGNKANEGGKLGFHSSSFFIPWEESLMKPMAAFFVSISEYQTNVPSTMDSTKQVAKVTFILKKK